MSEYTPPLQDMQFLLNDVLGFSHEDLDAQTIEAVLEEAAKLASNVLAPLNKVGDVQGATLKDGEVRTAKGFKEAYAQYCEGGWNAVPFDPQYGGQGLPWAIAFPVQEMWQGANMSFGLCPLLNQGAVKAILYHGSDEQKQYYLEKLISGEWTGTMNLTESHAGSDLGLLRAKALPQDDGSYKIIGDKIFITYGDHDMAENIIHLVLARIPDAPDDVKGLSLFIVPKILEDGSRNSLSCTGLEHKLGINASPTCSMNFDAAIGYLIGEENDGLKCMFTMMNNARLSVGLQGVAIAEMSYQHALAYANERVQGKSFTSGERVVIAHHADVARDLMLMKAKIEAARAITYDAAMALDKSIEGDKAAQEKVDLLTPIVKAWATDMAVEVTSIGLQIFGGMGFIEEAGAAQFYRDARILPIYEGTNGIQGADLAFRKVIRDGGKGVGAYINQMEESLPEEYKCEFEAALSELHGATKALIKSAQDGELDRVAGAASAYLNGFGIVAGGALLARSASVAKGGDTEFYKDKVKTAEFYMQQILPFAATHLSVSQKI